MTINPPVPVMEPAHFLSGVTSCMPCQTNCFAQPIRCQLSHLQLMQIFSRLAQQNSTSYSSLRVTKSHPTLPYYLLILSAGFVKVSFLLLENLRNCLYFLQSYELLIVYWSREVFPPLQCPRGIITSTHNLAGLSTPREDYHQASHNPGGLSPPREDYHLSLSCGIITSSLVDFGLLH